MKPWRMRSDSLLRSWQSLSLASFYGTRWFIALFSRVHHWTLPWASWIHSTPSHPVSLISSVMLSSYLCLGLRSGIFPSGFPSTILYEFLVTPTSYTHPAHFIFLDWITLIISNEEYKWWSAILSNFFPFSCYFLSLSFRYSPQTPLIYASHRLSGLSRIILNMASAVFSETLDEL